MAFNKDQPAYIALRDIVSERTTSLVAFVGAGLSRNSGLPSWRGLLSQLVRTLRAKANVLDPEEVLKSSGLADSIANNSNLWVSFEMLHDALGHETFRSEIKRIFAPAVRAPAPKEYCDLFALRLSGVITANIDRLATKAFIKTHESILPIEFSGFNCGSYSHILHELRPFILNLHGLHEQEESWVFTHSRLTELQHTRGYKELLKAIFMTRTVIFAGITADDIAVGGHLEALTDIGINGGGHFWLTDRIDSTADKWAEKNGVRLVCYSAKGDDHSELCEMLCDLRKHVPSDQSVEPIRPQDAIPAPAIRPVDDLLHERIYDVIRKELNAHAAWILSSRSSEAYTKYGDFLRKYDPAVYAAWYTSIDEPNNMLFGHKLISVIGEGAFGRVYEAVDPSGNKCAIKILKPDIRLKPDMLQSFRRGVLSMKILSESKVPGMVPYQFAAEIPACTVMEFIEGPNLQQHVETGQLNEWSDILDVGYQLATIIAKAHGLPQRVLHRDIRPPNIMLSDYYTSAEIKVVVLDFDLSWHMGATEASISHENSANPYLAPEQIDVNRKVSTRSAAVDSFGIGMTLYYMRSAKDPLPGQYRHRDWIIDVNNTICAYPCKQWVSLPLRFARLIQKCTLENQSARLDVTQIRSELIRLCDALRNSACIHSSEMIAEEVLARAARSAGMDNLYMWDENSSSGSMHFISGTTLSVAGDEQTRSVLFKIEWINKGNSQYQNIRKYMPDIFNKILSVCRGSGWDNAKYDRLALEEFRCSFSKASNDAAKELDRLADGVDKAIKTLGQISRI